MYDKEIILEFSNSIAGLFQLSPEHGIAIYYAMITANRSHTQSQTHCLHFSTSNLKSILMGHYGWKTEAPVLRILKDLENVSLIHKSDKHTFYLEPKIFGYKEWFFIEDITINMKYNNGKANAEVNMTYGSLQE